MPDLFVDRLGNIVIANGVARLDFLRLNDFDAERKQARMAASIRLAIPVTGLVQAIDMLDKLKAELLRQAQAGAPSPSATATATSTSEPATSPTLTTGPAGVPDA